MPSLEREGAVRTPIRTAVLAACAVATLTWWSVAVVSSAEPGVPPVPVAVRPQGDRALGLGLTEGAVGFEAAFSVATELGFQFVELPQQWDDVERAPKAYESAFLGPANEVYAASGTSIVVSINPIDTATSRVPTWWRGAAFDDPDLIRAFNGFVDHVLGGLPDATVAAISIGNEVDAWLGDDARAWAEYARFFAAVRAHVARRHPGVPVGVKMTWGTVVANQPARARLVQAEADAVMVTYYPLDDGFQVQPPAAVAHDLARLVEVAAGKPVLLLEVGYPSGSANGSSEKQQAAFVDAFFAAWDVHADAIPLANFVWLHDLATSDVAALTAYYALDAPAFASFLATLGLRTFDGIDKPAFGRLRAHVQRRGWR